MAEVEREAMDVVESMWGFGAVRIIIMASALPAAEEEEQDEEEEEEPLV